MLRKILRALAGIVVLVVVLALVAYLATSPERPPADSPSAAWLQPGPFAVGQAEFVFVDDTRPTAENRGVPGKPERTLPTTMWYPQNAEGPHPLIVHSHGILSNRMEMPYLMQALASRGYVVIATDYPLSSGGTEGGATADDVINQPGDITFLIDSVLALTPSEQPFSGSIDTNRIGLTGYSLGGLTTNLATFHPRLRDPRIAAAVSIAGVAAPFSEQFFRTTDVPYLVVSGTADALIEFERHAADIPRRVRGGAVVGIQGGNHLGFLGASDPTFRFMSNPDTLACAGVVAAVGENPNEGFAQLGTVEEGIDMSRDLPGLCDYGFPEAIHPGRQQMINQAAVVSFLESVFNPDAARRTEANDYLVRHLVADFTEVAFSH